MIKKLNESESLKFKRISPEEKEQKGILGRLWGPVASCVVPTRNGRRYSEQLWEKVFQNDIVKELFANGGLSGELQHPADREETDPEKIAIIMPEPPVKDNDGRLVGYVDILDTPCGRIAYQLAKYGFHFGISSRGTGDLISGINGEEVDPDTYQLNAFDLVAVPALKDARLTFTEGLETKKYNKTLKQALTEELDKASDEDKKIMNETLDNLNIKLNETNGKVDYVERDDISNATIYKTGDGKYTATYRSKTYTEDKLNDLKQDLHDAYYDQVKKYRNLPESKYTKDELIDKFGTDDLDIINAGNEEDVELKEKLVEPSEEDLAAIEDTFAELGLEIEGKGKTTFGNLHYQLRKELDHDVTRDDLGPIFDTLCDLSTDDMPTVCNVGVHRDGPNVVSASLDVLKKHVDDEDELDESVSDNGCSDKEDRVVKEDAGNSGDDLMKELQETLLKNKELEKDNLSLQEKLSVCNAKEKSLQEELKKYKTSTARLSDVAKDVKDLKEQLEQKDKVIKSSGTRIKNLLENKKETKTKLSEALSNIENLEKKIKSLNKSLNESISSNKELTAKNDELVKKYRKALHESKERYIAAKAVAYGISDDEVKSNLNESYSFKDIDSICEELSEKKLNMSKLPFRITEDTKISLKSKKDPILKGIENYDDDDVSDTLLTFIR